MTPLDRLSYRLGEGAGRRMPGVGGRPVGAKNVGASRDARPRKAARAEDLTGEKAPAKTERKFPIDAAEGVIPDPTAAIRRTVESTVRSALEGGGKKKRGTSKADAFVGPPPDAAPPNLGESDPGPDPDLGESDPNEGDTRESEQEPAKKSGRGMDFGMNSRIPTSTGKKDTGPPGVPLETAARGFADYVDEELRLERERALNDAKRTAASMRH